MIRILIVSGYTLSAQKGCTFLSGILLLGHCLTFNLPNACHMWNSTKNEYNSARTACTSVLFSPHGISPGSWQQWEGDNRLSLVTQSPLPVVFGYSPRYCSQVLAWFYTKHASETVKAKGKSLQLWHRKSSEWNNCNAVNKYETSVIGSCILKDTPRMRLNCPGIGRNAIAMIQLTR